MANFFLKTRKKNGSDADIILGGMLVAKGLFAYPHSGAIEEFPLDRAIYCKVWAVESVVFGRQKNIQVGSRERLDLPRLWKS